MKLFIMRVIIKIELIMMFGLVRGIMMLVRV